MFKYGVESKQEVSRMVGDNFYDQQSNSYHMHRVLPASLRAVRQSSLDLGVLIKDV